MSTSFYLEGREFPANPLLPGEVPSERRPAFKFCPVLRARDRGEVDQVPTMPTPTTARKITGGDSPFWRRRICGDFLRKYPFAHGFGTV